MRKIIIAVFVLVSSLSIISCEKEMEPVDVSKNAFLLERAWKTKGIWLSKDALADTPVYIDLFTDTPDCVKDNYLYFNTKNSGSVNDHWLKCTSTAPDQVPFYYNITENDNYITMYTDPDNWSSSVILQGKIETPDLDHFNVTYEYFDSTAETTWRYIYEFEKFDPEF